jgi:hypothetical protein
LGFRVQELARGERAVGPPGGRRIFQARRGLRPAPKVSANRRRPPPTKPQEPRHRRPPGRKLQRRLPRRQGALQALPAAGAPARAPHRFLALPPPPQPPAPRRRHRSSAKFSAPTLKTNTPTKRRSRRATKSRSRRPPNPPNSNPPKHSPRQGLGLEQNPDKPLVAVITRLVPQKGVHLIRAAVYRRARSNPPLRAAPRAQPARRTRLSPHGGRAVQKPAPRTSPPAPLPMNKPQDAGAGRAVCAAGVGPL